MPSGISSGDILVACFSADAATTLTATGWADIVGESFGDALRIVVRKADGTEGSTVNFTASALETGKWCVLRISGAVYVGSYLSESLGTTASPQPPEIKLLESFDILTVATIVMRNLSGPNSLVSSMTNSYTEHLADFSGAAANPILYVASKAETASTSTPGSITANQAQGSAGATLVLFGDDQFGGGGGLITARGMNGGMRS